MRAMQNDLYSVAGSRDAICEPMSEDLERITGKKSSAMIRKGLEPEHLSWLAQPVEGKCLAGGEGKCIRLAYAGSVLVEEEFSLLLNVLEKVRERTPLELHLFGAHNYSDRPWFRPWIVQHGNLTEEDLTSELRGMDWGISLMALHDDDPAYNRFSFPAKFCTYFSAGLPVLTVGHPESSLAKIANAYKVGVHLKSLETESMRSGWLSELSATLADAGAKLQYRAEMLRCIRDQFQAEEMRETLWKLLRG
jgi:hypothetical protein